MQQDVDADELVRRAKGLNEMIRADAVEAEQRGRYSPALHEAFVDAGFFSIYQPRKYGGLELGVLAQFRTMLEVARADPGIAWCLALGTDHTIALVSHFPEEIVRWAFEGGTFIASHSASQFGTATPVEGGFRVSSRAGYNSGIPYSTHAMLNVIIDSGPREGETIVCLLPREDYEIVDDWGHGRTMALGASGSNSVRVEGVFVPAERTVTWDWYSPVYPGGSPGVRSTGNPLYGGNMNAIYHGALAQCLLGAALGAAESFEDLLRTKRRFLPPNTLRSEFRDGQREFAQVCRMLDSAQSIYFGVATGYEELNRAEAAGEPVTVEDHMRLANRIYTVIELAWQATELMFRASGSSVGRNGHPIQRAFLALQMQRPQAYQNTEALDIEIGRFHFGIEGPVS